jgi:ABC-type cobalamin transport system permease subunit
MLLILSMVPRIILNIIQAYKVENIKTCKEEQEIDLLILHTPWRSILEKLTIAQLVNKFPALYGTLSFITVLVPT